MQSAAHQVFTQHLSRLVDSAPEVRYEAVLAVLRAALLLSGGMLLLLTTSPRGSLVTPAVLNLVAALASFMAAIHIARAATPERCLLIGRLSTVVDVAAYGAYSVAFHTRPGAGALLGIFVVLEGPLRYGLRGTLWSVVPVAAIAIAWPQLDVTGATQGSGQVVLLCLMFTLPTVLVRALIMRGSARVKQAERQFATAFEHAAIGMALLDLDLRVLQANRALAQLVGRPSADLHEIELTDVVDVLDRPKAQTTLRSLTASNPSARFEVRLRRPDGGLRWGHLSATLLTGAGSLAARVVVQVENITERKRSEAMLSHAAAHDSLTDLPNRSLLLARLEAALQRGDQVGVLFLDLDRFKVVNDGLGHSAGDLLLVQVAIRLREVMRPEDMVARLGGDEFVVLCHDVDPASCMVVADRVLAVLNQPVATAGGGELVIGGSIGIALGQDGDTAELLLRDADTAMYAAKQAGGGRWRLFTTELREAAVRTHELEVDLRAAVRAGELTVAYQPVINLETGRMLGCEALARWTHPRRGRVLPSEFIAVAEQSDLILELGELILAKALADLAQWPCAPGDPEPTVAVNVSLRQLVSSGFPERVAVLLAGSGTAPSRLCLEVTETALVGDVEHVIAVLHALRQIGVRLSIDDFGTGHASLTYLARFPVDQVKVDASFVAGLGDSAGSGAIVGGVIAMAHTFDLRVVAEGVETQVQLAALRELGCDAAQGYLLGVPMAQRELGFAFNRRAAGLVPSPRATNDLTVVLKSS